MHFLGINAVFHDPAAALVIEGEVVDLALAGRWIDPNPSPVTPEHVAVLQDTVHVDGDPPEAQRAPSLASAAGFALPPGDDGRLAVCWPMPSVEHLTRHCPVPGHPCLTRVELADVVHAVSELLVAA